MPDSKYTNYVNETSWREGSLNTIVITLCSAAHFAGQNVLYAVKLNQWKLRITQSYDVGIQSKSRSHYRICCCFLAALVKEEIFCRLFCSVDCFVVIFIRFYFFNALLSDNSSNTVNVLGHKYIYAHERKLRKIRTSMLNDSPERTTRERSPCSPYLNPNNTTKGVISVTPNENFIFLFIEYVAHTKIASTTGEENRTMSQLIFNPKTNREFKKWRRKRQWQHHKSMIWLVEWEKIIVPHVWHAF